jgi:alpha-beta hydrolase superfamily lysophospholipase
LILAVYFATPVLLLRFALDRLVFLQVNGGATHEDRLMDIPVSEDRSVRIRQYGSSTHCVIFFPGQHGDISTYERTLFPSLKKLGVTVYALSYPGQDGAQGRAGRATLIQDVTVAIAAISRETTCQPENAVFVGRSLGANLAIFTAHRVRPKGILVDGVAPTLTVAIRAAINRHIVLWPWNILPLRALVQDDFPLVPVVRSLRSVPIVIFQGTSDQVTPFIEAQTALAHEDNVRFFAVNGATHSNAYLLLQHEYTKQLAGLMAR